MSERLNSVDLLKLIEKSKDELNSFIEEKMSGNQSEKKRAGLLAYWIIDYIKFLRNERKFDSTKLLKYNRGDVVSVNFGYRIGSELGGRHFAFVLDNHNSLKSDVVTVVPFTSKKSNSKNNIYSYELKHGLFELHSIKLNRLADDCLSKLNVLIKEIETSSEEQFEILSNKIKKINRQVSEIESLKNSIEKLKDGTIVNLGQIITISKMRILNPKQSSDSLNKIKIHPDDLDIINEKLKYLYFQNSQNKNKQLVDSFVSGINSVK